MVMTSKPTADLPFNYLVIAIDFYNAAYSEYQRRGVDNLTIYSLIFHSFEVILKGYLLRSDINAKDVMKLNHDLCKALDMANVNGLSEYITNAALKCTCKKNNPPPPDTLCHLSAHADTKQLYYPSGKAGGCHPNADRMLSICKQLLLDLLDYVGGPFKTWEEQTYDKEGLSFIEVYFNAENGRHQVKPYYN